MLLMLCQCSLRSVNAHHFCLCDLPILVPTLRSKTVTGPTKTSVQGQIISSESSPLTSLDSLESLNMNGPSSSLLTGEETIRQPFLAPPSPPDIVTKTKQLTDSDSDSDSNYFMIKTAYTQSNTAYMNSKSAYNQLKMSSNIAAVEHVTTKHCPILTAGDISPKVLVDLTDAHNKFFLAKEIADMDKVKKILGGFRCVHIHDWISCEREHLCTLSYAAFMAELCENYLPPDWEESVHTQILGMQMRKNVKFWDWSQEMCALNIVLRGTDSHLTNVALHNQLEASLEPSLCTYCSHEKLHKVTDLKKWIQAVKDADEKLRNDRK